MRPLPIYARLIGRVPLPVLSFDPVHQECQAALTDLLTAAQVPHSDDTGYIFQALIPAPILLDRANPPGILSDIHADVAMPPAVSTRPAPGRPARYPHWQRDAIPARRLLFDVKAVHGGGTWYSSRWARDYQRGAVEERALTVHQAYVRHAQRLDSQLHRDAQGVPPPPGHGPIERRLASFTRVRGLVFGQYGEVSHDVDCLICLCAAAAARRTWRASGFRTEAEMRGVFTALYRRQIGLRVTRAFARHRLSRLALVGVPRAQLDAWRVAQRQDRFRTRGAAMAVGLEDVWAFQSAYRGPAVLLGAA